MVLGHFTSPQWDLSTFSFKLIALNEDLSTKYKYENQLSNSRLTAALMSISNMKFQVDLL